MDSLKKLFDVCEKKEKISQYKGVYWHKQMGKWYVLIYPTGQKRKYGGTFKDELDAAKRMNQLCEELRIPLQNSTISEMPNQQYQVTKKCFFVAKYENFSNLVSNSPKPSIIVGS